MNRNVVKGLINILMESPLYLELTLKERYQLLIKFMDLYASLPDSSPLFPGVKTDELPLRGKR